MKILCFSGGLDSLIAARYTSPDMLVYCKIGHRYQDAEFFHAHDLASFLGKELRTVDFINLSKYEEPDAEIPMRNMYLVMEVLSLALQESKDSHHEVVLTVQKDETSIPDRTVQFFAKASEILSSLTGKSIAVTTPFWEMDKTEMVQWYMLQGYPAAHLVHSYSCYKGDAQECGNCPACFRKWVALRNNGLLGRFAENPALSSTAAHYMEVIDKYSENRQSRIRTAMRLS
jgi:7-cyano-7-deazaguanine synthase in queuosine biosynthesis